MAALDPLAIATSPASRWLPDQLARRGTGELTVVWHSVVRQYVSDEEWTAVIDALREASDADPERPIVRVAMEPDRDQVRDFAVTLHGDPGGPGQIARCGDHGPPVIWRSPAPTEA